MYSYPYESRLLANLGSKTEGLDYKTWGSNNIQAQVASIINPVVEVGGPSPDGFYYLDKVSFNTKPIITNISSNPLPFSRDYRELSTQVTKIMDARHMPYEESSIGIFLMSAMSISSDWWVLLTESEKEKARNKFEAEFANARFEMGLVATGAIKPAAVKDAQRITIYLEIARCIQKNGLFFTDGGIDEIIILKQLGFELIACLQTVEAYGISYEFVVAKRH